MKDYQAAVKKTIRNTGVKNSDDVKILIIIIIIIIKCDHITKWYKYQPKSFLENETCGVLGDFEIQTDHLISARKPDQVKKKKKKKKKKKPSEE